MGKHSKSKSVPSENDLESVKPLSDGTPRKPAEHEPPRRQA